MNNLYFLFDFNNYYNRKLIRYETLQQYINAVGSGNYFVIDNAVNFNPSDGLSTQHIVNIAAYDIDSRHPNYMLTVDDNNNIEQRWFVTNCDRTRGGQYLVDLYRDTVAESFNYIKNEPAFIEKGILAQSDDMIFNAENMEYNQIKQSETLLKDVTGCPWVVGYMTQENVQKSNLSFIGDRETDYVLSTLRDYSYYDYTELGGQYMDVGLGTSTNTFRVFMNPPGTDASNTTQMIFSGTYGMGASFSTLSYYVPTQLTEDDQTKRTSFGQYVNEHANLIKEAISNELQINQDLLSEEDGKLIYIQSTGKYYTISVSTSISGQLTKVPKIDSGVYNAFEKVIQDANSYFPLLTSISTGSDQSYKYTVSTIQKQLVLEEVTFNTAIKYKISSGRNRLKDQPYSMFCMPCGTTTIDSFVGTVTQNWKEITLKVAQNISSNFGGASPVLYDIQLLPYFPFRDMIDTSNEHIELDRGTEGKDYDYIKQGSTNVGIIFWCTKSTDTFNISHSISVTDYKIDNETKMYRLCSPNYNGQFEFSVAKNGGLSGFNVDFTYKPFQPYIHVNPMFGRLYNRDFNDARGLVCGGKFDLPQTSDAWATYERQNTNYNAIFDRQIENLEFRNKQQRTKEIVSAVAGTIQGAGTGASVGSAGGPYGAIIGAAVGTFVSGAAGIADVKINDKLRKENLDYTKDMFGYNMQNIRALPNSLIGVGSLTANNKLFPFLEYYSATTEEVEALKNKIRFNGMTINRIDTINNIIQNTWQYSNGWNYIKCKLIRVDIGDYDYVNTLQSELYKGIFIGG